MNIERGTILIVDDDHDFAESLSAFLKTHGFGVLHAETGDEGLRLARLRRPDLILMDVMMNERTEGFFTVRALRRDPVLAAIPVFIVSAVYTAEQGFRVDPDQSWMGHDAFFEKPVALDALVAAIEKKLDAAPAATASNVGASPGGRP